MTFEELLKIQSGIADALGIIAFIIAIFTLIVAIGARSAAKAARASVEYKNMIDEVKLLCGRVKLLKHFVDKSDWYSADSITDELFDQVTRLYARSGADYGGISILPERIDPIIEAIKKAKSAPISDPDYVILSKDVRSIYRDLLCMIEYNEKQTTITKTRGDKT